MLTLFRGHRWEPIESFEGSEHIVAQFWARVDPGGRDVDDLSQFKAGEEFFPVGPPRMPTFYSSSDLESYIFI